MKSLLIQSNALTIPLASGNMWYNPYCLDEQNTGALCFQKAAGILTIDIVGKAPFTSGGLTSPAVRLGNGSAICGGRFAMRNKKGQFVDGEAGAGTRFKKGEHWREHKPYWDREWLYNEYAIKGRSSAEIAADWGVGDTAICFWLNKHGITTRTVSEVRAIKHWGQSGKDNPMHGKTGENNPNWRGGSADERQVFYSSQEWKRASKIVRKRDKQTCQRCGNGERPWFGKFHHIHHVIPFVSERFRADPDNLVLLCDECHRWVHSSKNSNKEFIGKEV